MLYTLPESSARKISASFAPLRRIEASHPSSRQLNSKQRFSTSTSECDAIVHTSHKLTLQWTLAKRKRKYERTKLWTESSTKHCFRCSCVPIKTHRQQKPSNGTYRDRAQVRGSISTRRQGPPSSASFHTSQRKLKGKMSSHYSSKQVNWMQWRQENPTCARVSAERRFTPVHLSTCKHNYMHQHTMVIVSRL
jgi:hypothetical protein